jgi:hypothetical protein
MTARRRKIFRAAALIAIVAAVAWWTTGMGSGAKVELRFLGYSNHTEVAQPYWSSAGPLTSTVQRVWLLATNCGSASVRLLAGLRGRSAEQAPLAPRWVEAYSTITERNLPQILHPGEATLLEVIPHNPAEPWWAELKAQRHQWRDRMHPKVQGISTAWIRRALEKFFSPPPMVWATLGPVTNPPPDTVRGPAEP